MIISTADRAALEIAGLLTSETTDETLEKYKTYCWTNEQMRHHLRITKTVRARLYLTDYIIDEHGTQLFCPLVVAHYIHKLLKKRGRGEDLEEFAYHVSDYNRRKSLGNSSPNRVPNLKKVESIIYVIHKLTIAKPNTRRAFEIALGKIGIYLPKLKDSQPQSTD